MLHRWLWTLAMLTAVAGCGSCDEEEGSRVPFKQEGNGPTGEDGDDEPGDETPFEARKGRQLAAETRKVAIQGAPVEVGEGAEAALRAVLALDVDGDGDRDALLIRTGQDGIAELSFARREGSSFGAPQKLGPLARSGPGCVVDSAMLRTVARGLGVASVDRTCDAGPQQTVALFSVEAQPRVRERMTLLPEKGRTEGRVAIALRTKDHDGDGHDDVLLDVSVKPPRSSSPAEVALPWLDRPGGLARDRDEPEQSILELADEARGKLGQDPDAALALARKALALHGVLCREGGAPRIRFGDSDGLECGRSAGAGRAAAVAAAGLARQGELFAALEAEQRMSDGAYVVRDVERTLVDRAWGEADALDGVTQRKVATHRAPSSPKARLPALGLLDSETLLLRGESPAVVHLGSGERERAQSGGGVLLRDPSEQYAVVEVHRACEGYVLTIVNAPEVVAGVVAGQPVSEPLLEPLAPPAGSHCPGRIGDEARNNDGGWRVLGWAPQGVVAARGTELRVVPLTVSAEPAGEPELLEPGTPPPAPLPHGAATPDGSAYALATEHGVLLRRLDSGDETVLLRPKGWSEVDGLAHEAAVAPGAERVAVMRGEEVWVLELPR